MASFKKQDEYIQEKCGDCGQTMTYLLPIDKGSVKSLHAIAKAIYDKGINCIHPRKEMEVPNTPNRDLMIRAGHITSNMVGNLSKPRSHGLIAKTGNQPGNYCLTTKGAEFLKGKPILKYAIISKKTGHQIGYWSDEMITIKDFSTDEEYWEGFYIKDGHVIIGIEKDPKTQKQLFILRRGYGN